MLDDFGTLSVRTYTAGGALPVAGASVRIFGAEEDNRQIVHSLITDDNGMTETVTLPAPSKEYSMTPTPTETPFAIYDIEVSADGYSPRVIREVPVFPGIYSLQPVNMLPSGAEG